MALNPFKLRRQHQQNHERRQEGDDEGSRQMKARDKKARRALTHKGTSYTSFPPRARGWSPPLLQQRQTHQPPTQQKQQQQQRQQQQQTSKGRVAFLRLIQKKKPSITSFSQRNTTALINDKDVTKSWTTFDALTDMDCNIEAVKLGSSISLDMMAPNAQFETNSTKALKASTSVMEPGIINEEVSAEKLDVAQNFGERATVREHPLNQDELGISGPWRTVHAIGEPLKTSSPTSEHSLGFTW